jgi:hypothetical protein
MGNLTPFVLILQGLTMVAVGLLMAQVRRLRAALAATEAAFAAASQTGLATGPAGTPAGRDEALESLARHLEGPFSRMYGELQAEHRRLRELVEQAASLAQQLDAVPHGSAEEVAADDEPAAEPAPPANPRLEARRLLSAGEAIDIVSAQTGLPQGEVRVLANLLRAGGERAGSEPARADESAAPQAAKAGRAPADSLLEREEVKL